MRSKLKGGWISRTIMPNYAKSRPSLASTLQQPPEASGSLKSPPNPPKQPPAASRDVPSSLQQRVANHVSRPPELHILGSELQPTFHGNSSLFDIEKTREKTCNSAQLTATHLPQKTLKNDPELHLSCNHGYEVHIKTTQKPC